MKNLFLTVALISAALFINAPAQTAAHFTLTVLYDNTSAAENVTADWGFSCLIEGGEKTVLFDTGTKPDILLKNCKALGVNLSDVDCIVISHHHGDHTGGLNAVLDRAKGVPVYFPASCPEQFSGEIRIHNGQPVPVDDPVKICDGISTSGMIRGPADEQALILETPGGLVVITGCSHPGIVTIMKRIMEMHHRDFALVFGGFHLMQDTDAQIRKIIEDFRLLGVMRCGATHCTGDRVIELFAEAYEENFISMGAGRVFKTDQFR